ncbi:hypothetical protein FHR83_009187 [Actinoplanes campanulatus]|uniref:PAS domain-containing protein n=1 Tax=Actinoplanes campanulatus TaxID=113559 RepID=A0A7W5AS93_9ACTN|nr:PAS domain-containing protein [Actinoplanes campanulatus]MBB3101458.1 hypothetical protein [Actinoplanes campanulatus]
MDVRSLAEAIPHSVWVISGPGTIMYANPHAVRYTGAGAQAAGSPWISIVHPDDVAAVQQRSAIAGLAPEPYEIDCRISRTGASFRQHKVSFVPVFDPDRPGHHWIATGTETAPAGTPALAATSRDTARRDRSAPHTPASADPVTIKFWFMPNGTDALRSMQVEADEFHRLHPNITVELRMLDWAAALTMISTAAGGGDAPDVTQLGTTWVGGTVRGLRRIHAGPGTRSHRSGGRVAAYPG